MHNPVPANRRRDPSDSIGVVSPDIFGAPGRGAVVEIWSNQSSGFIVAVIPRKKTTKLDGTIYGYGGRSRNDRKAKACKTLSNPFFIYIWLSSPKILPCVWKTCTQLGHSTIGNALALFRVRSTVRAAASRAAGWPSAIGNALVLPRVRWTVRVATSRTVRWFAWRQARPAGHWGSVLKASRAKFTRQQAYLINVGWTYKGRSNGKITCIVSNYCRVILHQLLLRF